MQPPVQPNQLNANNQYILPPLPDAAAAAAEPDYGLNNWQVMNNLGKFNAGRFGNAAANAIGIDVSNLHDHNGAAQGNGNAVASENEVAALNALLNDGNAGNPSRLVGERMATDSVITHYFLKVLGLNSQGNRAALANNGVGFLCTVDTLLTGAQINHTGANATTAADRRAHINTHANGFFVWLQQVISAPVAQVPLETKQALLKTIKETLQGKTVVANNHVAALNANEIKAKDAIVGLVQEIHKNPKLTNLLPVHGWGVVSQGAANAWQADRTELQRILGHLTAWNNGVAGGGYALARVDGLGDANLQQIIDAIKNNHVYNGQNGLISAIRKYIADSTISLQDKRAFLLALHESMDPAGTIAAASGQGNVNNARDAIYADAALGNENTLRALCTKITHNMKFINATKGKFQISGGDIAGTADEIKTKTKAIADLYDAIGGNGDITTAINAVTAAGIVQPIQKIQGGYDYESGRAITPVQHAIHVLSTYANEEQFNVALVNLSTMLEKLPNQAGVKQEDLAIAVKKFGNNDAKLAQVLDVLISNYKQPAQLVAAFLENQPYKELPAVPANDNSLPANRILALLQNDTTVQCAGLYNAMVAKQNEFKNLATGNVDIFDGKDNRPNINLSQYEAKYKNIIPPVPLPYPVPIPVHDKTFDEIHGRNQKHREKILNKMQALFDNIQKDLQTQEKADYNEAYAAIAKGGGTRLKFAKSLLGDLYDDLKDGLKKKEFKSIIDDLKHEINPNIKHDEHHKKPEKHHHHEERHHEKINLGKLQNDIFIAAKQAKIPEGNRRKVAKLIGEFAKENGGIRGVDTKENRKLHEKWNKFAKNHNALKDVNYKTACAFSAYFKKDYGKRLADIDPKDINATLKERGR